MGSAAEVDIPNVQKEIETLEIELANVQAEMKGFLKELGLWLDGDRFKYGTRFSTRYFDDLVEEIRDIRSSERMLYQKIMDLYATAVDYSPAARDTKDFFASGQNKLHFAITGRTAAEIIAERAMPSPISKPLYHSPNPIWHDKPSR